MLRGVLPMSLLLSDVLLNARLKAMANQHHTQVSWAATKIQKLTPGKRHLRDGSLRE